MGRRDNFLSNEIITLHQFFVDAIDEPLEVPSKVCKKCRVLKPLEEFHVQKAGKFGRLSKCKCCVAIYDAEHKEEILAQKAIYYAENKEEKCAKAAIYRAGENKDAKAAKAAIYYADPENKGRINKRQKERKASDPLYKLECNMRNLIGKAMKRGNFKKTSKTADILGCTYEQFQTHIENQFQPNMTWQNAGEWHIDHFFPVSWATNKAQALLLNQYVNLRPLWAVDNHFKSAKAPYTIDKETGEINILLECDREYINKNLEALEAFLKELQNLA